jgi:hypothetical protein
MDVGKSISGGGSHFIAQAMLPNLRLNTQLMIVVTATLVL